MKPKAVKISASRNGCTRIFLVDLAKKLVLDMATGKEDVCKNWWLLCMDLGKQGFNVEPKIVF